MCFPQNSSKRRIFRVQKTPAFTRSTFWIRCAILLQARTLQSCSTAPGRKILHLLQQMNITGLHHVTAIASDPQRNLEFYVGVLGLRLVKRTINFDDPGSYHFYFGDGVGTPGTILTFFPWPDARPGVRGVGEIEATAFAIPAASVGYWLERLKEHHVVAWRAPQRFGDEII